MWVDRNRSADDPKLVELLKQVRDIANWNVADEWPRDASEPHISIWEYANNCLRMLDSYESGK